MPSGSVPEAAEPGIRSQHLPRVVAGEQFDRRAELRPLSHPPLGDLDAPGRVHRLNPAGLFLLGLNLIAPREIEQDGGAVTHQTDKTFTRCPMPGNDVLRVMPRQCRDHLSIVAAGCAPARLHGFDDGDVHACLAQMQRGRQAGEAATDHDDIGLGSADQPREIGTGRRHRDPQRTGPADICGIHRSSFVDRR